MFDETFVHWVKNETEQTRVILFCDIERPLRSRLLTRLNRWISGILGVRPHRRTSKANASAASTRPTRSPFAAAMPSAPR